MRLLVSSWVVLALLASAGSAVAARKPTAGSNNVGASWSPDSERIAFASDGRARNNYDVWVMQADGSAQRNLTPDGTNEGVPVWSPDGRLLAFTSTAVADPASPSIEVIASSGAARRVLAHGSGPSWSPDGRRLAYVAADGLRTIDIDGSDDRLVASTTTSFRGDTAWSPGGSKIAYVQGDNLWVVDADGANAHPLTAFPASAARSVAVPVWARDGSALAFVASGTSVVPAPNDIWTVDAEGGGLKRLASFALLYSGPSWMPDARSIVFTAAKSRDGDLDIYRVALDGSDPVDITNDGTWDEGSTVAPDGTRIAFGVRYGTGFQSSDIWTLDLRTGARRNLTGVASGLTVDARAVKPPNKLVIRDVTASVDRSFGPKPILRVRVHVRNARTDDVRNAVVTMKLSTRSLTPMRPAHRTNAHGETELDFRGRTRRALPAGTRLTLVVGAHPPGSYSRSVVAAKRVTVRL